MSDALRPNDDSLTDAELDAVAGGGTDTATHWGCGLPIGLGDSTHSGQSRYHFSPDRTGKCNGTTGYNPVAIHVIG